VYLDAAFPSAIPAGSRVRLAGVIDSRYAERTLRVAVADVEILGAGAMPDAIASDTGAASEPLEGLRLVLLGSVVEAPTSLSDGLGLLVDDGTGPVRVIVAPSALDDSAPVTGDLVTATGPLGQRDSGGTGSAGYRLYATLPGELTILQQPTPSPTAAPSQTPEPSATPSATATPTPSAIATPTATPTASTSPTPTPSPTPVATPSPTPTPTSAPVGVAKARSMPEGSTVVVAGVVIAEAGRLGTPPLFAIGDATAGLPVRLADGQVAPSRGTSVVLRGTIAAPYGQTELRLVAGGLTTAGAGALPAPLSLLPSAVGEPTEGRLARIAGSITVGATKATSGDLAFAIRGTDGATLRIMADASAGLDPTVLRKGADVTLTGVVGQRASHKGALDGYRLWVRDRADVTIRATASPSPTPSPSPSSTAAPILTIAVARVRDGAKVTVEGTITVDRTLLDSSGRRAIIEDGTGAIELYLAAPDASIKTGARVRATGVVGRAWGAPRLRAEAVRTVGSRVPVVHDLNVVPGAATEWRLVRVRGTLRDVHHTGDRWTADLVNGSLRVAVIGLPGSGVVPASVVEGRQATLTGVVKRPYPTATDRRFAVLPRSPGDLVSGAAPAGASLAGSSAPGASSGPGGVASSPGASPASTGVEDVPLSRLGDRLGATVRVGGLVTSVDALGARVDDGTATVLLVFEGAAADLAGLVQAGDAVNATGVPEARDELVLVVRDPSALVLLGDLGGEADGAWASPGAAALGGEANVGGTLGGAGGAVAASLGGTGGPDPFVLTLGALIVVLAVAAGWATYRTVKIRRAARARIRARITAIAGPSPAAGPLTPA
jgi:hypothetical protein